MKCLKKIRQLFDELNKSIIYCHWKSNQHFDNALVGVDDLDILIDRNQYEQLIEILGKLSFKHFYIPTVRSYPGIEDWLGFDEETGMIFHLHLHSKLCVGEKHLKGFCLPIEKAVLKNRVWDEDYKVYFSSPNDELLLLILRSAMKNRKRDVLKKSVIGNNSLNEFEWLKKNENEFIKSVSQYNWISERIKKDIEYLYLNGFKWLTLNKMKHHLYRDLAPYSLGSCFYNTTLRHMHELGRILLEIRKKYLKTNYSLLRRRSATGGVTIAFIGADGSGKSTVIQDINNWLIRVMDVRYFYLGSGDGKSSFFRFPLIIAKELAIKTKLIKKSNNFTENNSSKNNNSKKRLKFIQKIWIYALSRERIHKLLKISRCRNRGFVVITDRYPQDEYDGLCDGRRLRNQKGIAASKETHLFELSKLIQPDLVIKLVISPEEAVRRKPKENDLETSKYLTDRIKNINFSDYTKKIIINAEKPYEQEIIEIKNQIWMII